MDVSVAFIRRAGGRHRRRRRREERPRKYVPNAGFCCFDGDQGQVYSGSSATRAIPESAELNESYTDAFGNTHTRCR
jgi:hypothetical protein